MATKSNADSTVFETVDPKYKAGRVSSWPQEGHGSYRFAGFTGLLPAALAANAEIFQFRWASATDLCVLRYLYVKYQVITGFTAAQELAFDALTSTAWSVNGSGGAAFAPSATNFKKRQTSVDSKIADLRIATTAALGVGTKTLSNTPILAGIGKTLAAAATVMDGSFGESLDLTQTYDDPFVFAQNEGLSIRNSILLGAGGTVRATIQLAWSEFTNAQYP